MALVQEELGVAGLKRDGSIVAAEGSLAVSQE